MTKYEKAAKRAVAEWLEGRTDPVTMFSVSCKADEVAIAAGKKKDLYPSLHDYEDLKPEGWKIRWLTTGGDSLLMVCPPGWQEGKTASDQLLLGAGKLRSATMAETGN